jgi:hypothetical protein
MKEQGGISVAHPLSDDAGMSSGTGIMASAEGQLIASYLVRCALPPDRFVEKYDADGNLQRLEGRVGVAPEWESGACDESCQEWVSACMLAHVNLTGEHVGIGLKASHAEIDWSTSAEYPNEEAAYFGNLFAKDPASYVCFGRDVAENPIPGRVCVNDQSCPYVDPYRLQGGSCEASRACSGHTAGSEHQGYESCRVSGQVFSHVITVWKR